jgi:TolB protein
VRRFIVILAVAAAASIVLLSVAPAQATAPGKNGRIAFRRYLNASHTWGAIFTIKPDGMGLHQVTNPHHGVLTAAADWSPNGRWIAYARGTEDDARIFKIRPDGTHHVFLSGSCRGPCIADLQPAFSPRGKRIVFSRAAAAHPTVGGLIALYVMRADGFNAHRVTQRGASLKVHNRFEDLDPQWSPSGKRVVFDRYDKRHDNHAMFTVRLDGTGLRRLTRWRMDATLGDWSPNGNWILFISHEDTSIQNNIFLVRPNGKDLHRVTHTFGGTYHWFGNTFSPDGRFIVGSRVPGHGKQGNADVYVMNVDGTGLRNVTSSGIWDSGPDWGAQRR